MVSGGWWRGKLAAVLTQYQGWTNDTSGTLRRWRNPCMDQLGWVGLVAVAVPPPPTTRWSSCCRCLDELPTGP